jgi:cysteinyl-tRNA synthetase
MDYGDNTMSHALVAEKLFKEFFHNAKAILRQGQWSDEQKWDDATCRLQLTLLQTQTKVDEALCNDFDTPAVMVALTELVKATNVYMEKPPIVSLAIRNVASYVTRIFQVFGLIGNGTDIGFESASGEGASREETLGPVLDALMDFRSQVRDKARAQDVKGVLQECDTFRDDTLPELGIRLEDKTGGKSVWKLADPQELLKEKEQKELEERRKEDEKAKAAEEQAKKEALNALPPTEFMKQLTMEDGTTLKYTQFDDQGFPTHGNDNEPLNKNQIKKATKEFQTQEKKYQKWAEKQQS